MHTVMRLLVQVFLILVCAGETRTPCTFEGILIYPPTKPPYCSYFVRAMYHMVKITGKKGIV